MSYAGFALFLGMFPAPPARTPATPSPPRGHLALLDALVARDVERSSNSLLAGGLTVPPSEDVGSPGSSDGPHGSPPAPPGFFEAFCERWEGEGLAPAVDAVARDLGRRLKGASPLGSAWHQPLRLFVQIASVPAAARALVASPAWLPPRLPSGRAVQTSTLLGPAFSVSFIPDATGGLPQDVRAAAGALLGLGGGGPAGAAAAADALEAAQEGVQAGLAALVMALLRGKDTREPMLAWLGAALASNEERAKMQPDLRAAAAHGWVVNLASVLLRACEPFLDPGSGKAWGRVSAAYVADGRVDWTRATRLAADEGEAAAWAAGVHGARLAAAAAAAAGGSGEGSEPTAPPPTPPLPPPASPSPPYSFICECFWMAAKAAQLGPARLAEEARSLATRLHYWGSDANAADAVAEAAGPGPAGAAARAQAAELRRAAESTKAYLALVSVAVRGREGAARSVAFWRLASAWLLREASPSVAAGGPPEVPLPPPSPAWRCLPENLLTDMVDILRSIPGDALDAAAAGGGGGGGGGAPAEVVALIVTLVASPGHVRNPFARAQLAQLLHDWLLPGEDGGGGGGGQRPRRDSTAGASGAVAGLVASDPLAAGRLVPSLMALYADIEHTARNAAFVEKFGVRLAISRLLAHLWDLPSHRPAWRAAAAEGAGSGGKQAQAPPLPPGSPYAATSTYGRFMHHLVTDATYLLDDAMLRLARLAEHERGVADAAGWAALPATARDEREAAAQADAQAVPGYLDLASACIATIGFTTSDPATASPWLSRAMVGRTAEALNYFLKHLAGPGRRGLRVADPGALHWRPKEMLASLAAVYVNLARAAAASGGDAGMATLAAALASDTRSFSADLLPAAAEVLAAFDLLSEADLGALAGLADAAAAAVAGGPGAAGATAAAAAAALSAAADAPDEFLDPLTCDLMEDPVRLPSSGQVLDRACVERLLLSDGVDPFNKAPLRLEDCVPQADLRARIADWKAARAAVAEGGVEEEGAGGG